MSHTALKRSQDTPFYLKKVGSFNYYNIKFPICIDKHCLHNNLPFLKIVIGDRLSVPLKPWIIITFFLVGLYPEYSSEYGFFTSILSLFVPVYLEY